MSDDDPYKLAEQFARLHRSMEYGLKRSGYLKKGRDDAQADWAAYANVLGDEFFDSIVARGIAPTLIGDPPRKLAAADLTWEPKEPDPLKNTTELIVEGVCRVRNSLVHGEKFVGGAAGQWDRDVTLVAEAFAVLKAAAEFVDPSKTG